MHRLIPIALACGALAGPASMIRAADFPIPQNPARQEQAFRDLLEWNRRTLGGAYDRVGKKDPRWDKSAREALELAARIAGKAIDPAASWEDVYAPAKRAVEAGCDDPLILFVFADSSRIPNRPDAVEWERRWATAARAMEQSANPPLRRGLAFFEAGMATAKKGNPTPADRKEAARLFDAALAILPRAAEKEERGAEAEDEWFNLAKNLVDGYRQLDGNIGASVARVDGVLAKMAGMRAIRLQIKAHWLITEAWEIRGHGLGDAVVEDNARRFEEKNIEAYKALQQAWVLNSKSYRTPTMMLALMTTLGGERSEMEAWFRRAMDLKDNNAVACNSKMNYLDPKWRGSREEMIEFAKACSATKNWRGGITVVAATIHMRWAMQLDNVEATRYLRSLEVWEHGKAIYEEYLSHHAADDVIRSDYAGFAFYCGQRAESAKQFNILGDKLVGSRPYPLQRLKQFRTSLEEEARRKEEGKAKDAKRSKSESPANPPK